MSVSSVAYSAKHAGIAQLFWARRSKRQKAAYCQYLQSVPTIIVVIRAAMFLKHREKLPLVVPEI